MANQKGVALIVVLMVVALVTVIATDMGTRLQLQVRKTSNIKDNNQAYWYAMGAEEFARVSLTTQIEDSGGVINLNQPWANTDVSYPVPGGAIEGELKDMQSCFNLNAIQPKPQAANNDNPEAKIFRQMVRDLDIEIPDFSADTLAGSLIDWLDKDSRISDYGAEDGDYEALSPPYLAANDLMVNKSELRLVNGVELDWLNDLLPHVCVIPKVSELKVNVNTLTEEQAPLLKAMLGDNVSVENAQSIIANRRPEGFEKKADFFSVSEVTSAQLTDPQKEWFDVTTQYFILHIKTTYNRASFSMSSLFHIDENKKVSVIRREFGGIH